MIDQGDVVLPLVLPHVSVFGAARCAPVSTIISMSSILISSTIFQFDTGLDAMLFIFVLLDLLFY